MGWTVDQLLALDQEYDEVLREVAPKWLGVRDEAVAGDTADEWTRLLGEEARTDGADR